MFYIIFYSWIFFFPDTFVVTRSEQDMNETFGHLMENLYLVLKAVNNLESHLKDHGETIPCKTDC